MSLGGTTCRAYGYQGSMKTIFSIPKYLMLIFPHNLSPSLSQSPLRTGFPLRRYHLRRILDNERFEEGFGSWRSVSERAVGPEGVVLNAPAFDDYLSIPEGVKDLSIQHFVSESAVETFTVPILPRAARSDVEGSYACSFEPLAYCLSGEFRAVI